MATRNSTRFAFLLLILAVSSCFAQTRYISMSQVEDPPYGIVAQLWNSSNTPVYLESVESSGAASVIYSPATDGILEFGYGLSNLEEQQCQAVQATVFGGNSLVVAPNDGVRVSQQPCTPNGLKYGVAYTGTGSCNGYNYTCTNFIPIKRCWGAVPCSVDLTVNPLVVQPGTGITLYSARYKDPYAFGWQGVVTVTFRWHR